MDPERGPRLGEGPERERQARRPRRGRDLGRGRRRQGDQRGEDLAECGALDQRLLEGRGGAVNVAVNLGLGNGRREGLEGAEKEAEEVESGTGELEAVGVG